MFRIATSEFPRLLALGPNLAAAGGQYCRALVRRRCRVPLRRPKTIEDLRLASDMMSCSFSPALGWRRLAAALAILLPIAATTPASAQLFGGGDSSETQRRQAELSLRVNQLEGQLRQMNGQVEQMSFQVKQLNDLIGRMQKDFEFRLQDLEAGGQATKRPPQRKSEAPIGNPAQPTVAAVAPAMATAAMPTAAPMPPAGVGRQGPGAPPVSLGTLSGDDAIGDVIADAPLDLSQPPSRRSTVTVTDGDGDVPPGVRLGPAAPTAPTAPPTRTAAVRPVPPAADQYDAAYGYMLSGEYALAETSFKAFLGDHPTDKRAASGQYWLGESFYSRKMYREAADAFLTSYQQYPSSPKAPDSLLKLGLSLNGLGEKRAACTSFDELLTKYPKASKALRDLAVAEKNRAKCG
jgi:tol-pal system protein YbgF